jgi:hypothetical protein
MLVLFIISQELLALGCLGLQVILFAGLAFMVLRAWGNLKWVFVKYYDGERMRSTYFADSSLVGLGRRSARTEQIYEALRPYSRQS